MGFAAASPPGPRLARRPFERVDVVSHQCPERERTTRTTLSKRLILLVANQAIPYRLLSRKLYRGDRRPAWLLPPKLPPRS
jgi:hypothetical protein